MLLGVAHGSRDAASQQVVQDLLAAAAAQRPGLRAEPAYIDNASPSIADAIEALVAAGERDITVLPLLLNAASHSKTDVAGSVQKARLEHPSTRISYGRPFGAHPAVVETLALRLEEAGAGDLPVLMVASGGLDPDANATVAATARLLFEGRTFPLVDYAFAGSSKPSVAEAAARMPAGFALSLCFLGPGFLPGRAVQQAGAEVVAQPLGVSPQLVDLVLERFDEAQAGDVRMNCDACLYRIAFPGLTDKVGAPQIPHTHPDNL